MNRLILFLVALALGLAGNFAVPGNAAAQENAIEAQHEFGSSAGATPSLLEPTKGGQSGVLTAPIESALFAFVGNPTFSFTALHTVASGTVEVHVILWAETSTAGVYSSCGVVDKVTLTASSSSTTEVVNSVTYYPALEILDYAGRGATHVELRVVGNPSGGGSVRLRGWTHARRPRGQ